MYRIKAVMKRVAVTAAIAAVALAAPATVSAAPITVTAPTTFSILFDGTVGGPPFPELPAQADFTFTPSNPTAGAAVTFRSTTTVGAGATIVRHVWNFDDGNPPVDSGSTTSYVYPGFAAASTHGVTLTVTDSLGRTSTSAPRTVTIP